MNQAGPQHRGISLFYKINSAKSPIVPGCIQILWYQEINLQLLSKFGILPCSCSGPQGKLSQPGFWVIPGLGEHLPLCNAFTSISVLVWSTFWKLDVFEHLEYFWVLNLWTHLKWLLFDSQLLVHDHLMETWLLLMPIQLQLHSWLSTDMFLITNNGNTSVQLFPGLWGSFATSPYCLALEHSTSIQGCSWCPDLINGRLWPPQLCLQVAVVIPEVSGSVGGFPPLSPL